MAAMTSSANALYPSYGETNISICARAAAMHSNMADKFAFLGTLELKLNFLYSCNFSSV